MEQFEKIIIIEDGLMLSKLLGSHDKNLKLIKSYFGSNILIRGNEIKIFGQKETVSAINKVINTIIKEIEYEGNIDEQKILYFINSIQDVVNIDYSSFLNQTIVTTNSGRTIKPKTIGQKRYCELIKNNDITFGIGPAGTGKTYLAVAQAINSLRKKEVDRIILTRPAVEAGEKLGFLPGDLQDKVDPYLRPLYDALFDIMGMDSFMKNLEKQIIEVAPLAYMRGRTIDSAFIILDEAQNTTNEQMKMFLTRLGYGSKAVITGDITQIDLPSGKSSGLKLATKILNNVKGIGFMEFAKKDIVRHKLVQDIVKAYEKFEENN